MDTSLTDEFIGQRLENYVIERLLGAGGMANVYQARDTLHGREVAIKALSPVFLTDPGYVERFRREAHRIAALEHPSIVTMLQFIERDRRAICGDAALRRIAARSPRLQATASTQRGCATL